MVGWHGTFPDGQRPAGIHPLASIGGPPENRKWRVGDPTVPPVIAKSALIQAFVTVDAAMEGEETRIGERTFLMAHVHVGEGTVIGDDVEVGNGAIILGHVTIGDGARVWGNSWIRNRVVIGAGAVIGGGSVVIRDVPAHEIWCGDPARFLKLAPTHPDYDADALTAAPPPVTQGWVLRGPEVYPPQSEVMRFEGIPSGRW